MTNAFPLVLSGQLLLFVFEAAHQVLQARNLISLFILVCRSAEAACAKSLLKTGFSSVSWQHDKRTTVVPWERDWCRSVARYLARLNQMLSFQPHYSGCT